MLFAVLGSMTQTSNEMIYERLGSLRSEMDNNRSDVADLRALMIENDKQATQSRKALYEAVDQIKIDMASMYGRVDDIAKQAKRGVDVAVKVEKWEQQGKGVLIAVGISGASLAAGFTVFFQNVIHWLKVQLGL